jgi:glutathione S-transferase
MTKLMLIGQYDSPFVRRVAVALQIYGMPFEHAPWSVWSEAEKVARYNPLRRVPALVLDDQETLYDSATILDALDDMVEPERALLPRTGPVRRRGLRICALATGAADKGVSLLYEQLLRSQQSPTWVERCGIQIQGALDVLEADRATTDARYWLGDEISHADIAVTCVLRFLREANGSLIELSRWPRLAALAEHCESLDVFRSVTQPLIVTIKRDT